MPTSVSTIVIPMNYLNFTPTFFAATGQREPKNGIFLAMSWIQSGAP